MHATAQRAHETLFLGMLGGLGHAREGFRSQQRPSLSRQRFFSPMSQQEFSVATGFGARLGLGGDKGLLMSRRIFPRGGTFLSRHKTLCRDRNSKGGVATKYFSIATQRTGLPTRQGAGRARQA